MPVDMHQNIAQTALAAVAEAQVAHPWVTSTTAWTMDHTTRSHEPSSITAVMTVITARPPELDWIRSRIESGHQGYAEKKGGFIWRAGLFILFLACPRIGPRIWREAVKRQRRSARST
jgi:hypothetical protein